MRGRDKPPLSEEGSHWRMVEKGMRSMTLGFSAIVGETAKIKIRPVIALVIFPTGSIAHQLQTGSE